MALIKTIAEIKEVLPKLVSNLNSQSLLPNFNAVEEKYLTPLIGDALYDSLQTKYNANTLTSDELILVKHIRLVIGSYAFLDETAATHVFLTDQGVRVNSTGNMQKAVGWEYKELKKFLKDRALDGTEVLLKYMWKKKADLPLWTESEAYKQFEGLIIRTGTDFSDQYRLFQPMRTFYSIKQRTADAQDFYLVSGLGKTLVDYFLQKEDPSDGEKEILKQLKKALAFFTIKHTGEHDTVRFGENGFTVVEDNDTESDEANASVASVQLLNKKLKACDRDGKNFMLAAKRLLVAYRKGETGSIEFNTAFDASKLFAYIDPKCKTSGNERRKIFRF